MNIFLLHHVEFPFHVIIMHADPEISSNSFRNETEVEGRLANFPAGMDMKITPLAEVLDDIIVSCVSHHESVTGLHSRLVGSLVKGEVANGWDSVVPVAPVARSLANILCWATMCLP